jgi:hypothetical protein
MSADSEAGFTVRTWSAVTDTPRSLPHPPPDHDHDDDDDDDAPPCPWW